MRRKFISLAVLALGMLLQTSPAPMRALRLEPAGLTPAVVPVGGFPASPPAQADFDRDGQPERLAFAGGRLTILSNGMSAWQSPEGWTVIQNQITDLNRDDRPEVAMLIWRAFRPWPVDQWLPHGGRIDRFQDEDGNSCHIILIGWRGRAYGELWAGSALAEPVRSFAAADLNGDGFQELLTLEGSYADVRLSSWFFKGSVPARTLKVWEWNGFGFSVVSSIEGTFHALALIQANAGRILVLVP